MKIGFSAWCSCTKIYNIGEKNGKKNEKLVKVNKCTKYFCKTPSTGTKDTIKQGINVILTCQDYANNRKANEHSFMIKKNVCLAKVFLDVFYFVLDHSYGHTAVLLPYGSCKVINILSTA